uniref:Transmembrane protein n=1 Tax=Cacopsylla melanoneura TaxID=428564 RepID=A0A8D9ARJ5_9HEMI
MLNSMLLLSLLSPFSFLLPFLFFLLFTLLLLIVLLLSSFLFLLHTFLSQRRSSFSSPLFLHQTFFALSSPSGFLFQSSSNLSSQFISHASNFPSQLLSRTSTNFPAAQFVVFLSSSSCCCSSTNFASNAADFPSTADDTFLLVSFLFPIASTLRTVPLSFRFGRQRDACKVEPLDWTVRIVAANHLSVRHLLADAVRWFVRIDRHVQDVVRGSCHGRV